VTAAAEQLERSLGRRPTLAERGVSPSGRPKGSGADWDNAVEQFPTTKADTNEWVDFFDRRPEVLLAILGDIYRESKALEAREAGRAPTGRRPKHINGNLAELEAMITPSYSMEPFGVACRELIGDRSLRAFAARVPMNHHTLTRMMRGELKVDRFRLEAIAKAGRVTPAYFMEWRLAYVQEAVEQVFMAKPNLSIRAIRQLQRARAEGSR
jgi:hypothetical protein